jgi:hypothetical protein
MDEIIGDHQCGFQHNRSTADNIFHIHQVLEKKMGAQGDSTSAIQRLEKAYDSVRRHLNPVFQPYWSIIKCNLAKAINGFYLKLFHRLCPNLI